MSLVQQSLAERLHDGPLQELVALQLKIAGLLRRSEGGDDPPVDRLLELGHLAQAAIDHLRQIVRELTQSTPQPVALLGRLTGLCEEFRAGTGIDCQVELKPEHTQFSAEVSDVLFRTVHELLTNVRKHAQATLVKITSRYCHDGSVAITVEDNGVGMAARARRSNPFEGGGFGLWSIDHRLSSFGGVLEIEGGPGLCATIVIPGRLLVAG